MLAVLAGVTAPFGHGSGRIEWVPQGERKVGQKASAFEGAVVTPPVPSATQSLPDARPEPRPKEAIHPADYGERCRRWWVDFVHWLARATRKSFEKYEAGEPYEIGVRRARYKDDAAILKASANQVNTETMDVVGYPRSTRIDYSD